MFRYHMLLSYYTLMTTWFKRKDIKIRNSDIVYLDDLQGYVIPHASTQFTGRLISDILRYRPRNFKDINMIVIIYLPSQSTPNVKNRYFHEFYVVWKSLSMVYQDVDFVGFNVLTGNVDKLYELISPTTLVVVSADFSHFKPFKQALALENCAAHSLMHKHLQTECIRVVDDVRSFRLLFNILKDVNMQWIGRTRSPGIKAVGYHGYLLRKQPNLRKNRPDGFFVTAYDTQMRQRECLGNLQKWSSNLENKMVADVIRKASTTSRLTGGNNLSVPVEYYTVTYLYKENNPRQRFIRGWHGILKDAFYLPDVFLENTFEDGRWITPKDTEWPDAQNKAFDMTETLNKLQNKAGMSAVGDTSYVLYKTHVKHKKLN